MTRFVLRVHLIERVNDRGVPIDRVAAERILYQMEEQKAALREECIRLTGFEPTQTEKLRAFLGTPDMTAATLQSAVFHDPIADRVRDIRLAVSKAAAGKIKPMLDLSVDDARARGCLVSNGAHTGRGSSRKIQLHNLKRSKTDEEMFRRLHRGEVLDMPILHAQENIRGFLRAEPGNRFVVADYSQIECRLLAWIADEQDLMAAFSSGHDVYRLMAANIYQVPVEEVTDEQRLLGKVGTLGSGYGVSGPGLARQAPGFGLTIDDELGWHAVHSFRNTFPGVVKLWHQLDKGIIGVVLGKRERFRAAYCEFTYKNSCLVVTLPSGRALRYFRPEVRDGKYGPVLYFQGRYGFSLVEKRIWGGHWVENLCQAIATDIKLDAMKKLDAAGEQIVLEVHDEIIIEAAEEEAEDTLKRTLYTMTHDLPEWFTARKLIKAEGFTCERYTK